LAQALFSFGLIFLAGSLIAALAFHGEHRLIQLKKRAVWLLPFPAIFTCLIYGSLRASGWLVYTTDGWDTAGIWNYTNQNQGTLMLFLGGCLLIGVILAVYKNKFPKIESN